MSEEHAHDEARRLNEWLQTELEHQRAVNSELRRAVAELARTFQETLARANEAAESGDIYLGSARGEVAQATSAVCAGHGDYAVEGSRDVHRTAFFTASGDDRDPVLPRPKYGVVNSRHVIPGLRTDHPTDGKFDSAYIDSLVNPRR